MRRPAISALSPRERDNQPDHACRYSARRASRYAANSRAAAIRRSALMTTSRGRDSLGGSLIRLCEKPAGIVTRIRHVRDHAPPPSGETP